MPSMLAPLGPDDVIQYAWGDTRRPTRGEELAAPSDDYEPASPRWIDQMTVDKDCEPWCLWARVYRLTDAASARLERKREEAKEAAAEAALAAIELRVKYILEEVWFTIPTRTVPPWPGLDSLSLSDAEAMCRHLGLARYWRLAVAAAKARVR